jgi:hypothetical protein
MKKQRDIASRPSVTRALQRAIRLRHSVRIERYDGVANIYGFPLALGRRLVLLQVTEDFDLDGYTVLPVEQIAEATHTETQSFFDRVLNDRGSLRRVQKPKFEVAVDAWIDCVRALASRRQLLIVDCEKRDSDTEDTFFLGSIVAISGDSMAMCHVSATAEWYEEPPSEIPYADITRIRFGDAYSTTFAKYVSTPPAY